LRHRLKTVDRTPVNGSLLGEQQPYTMNLPSGNIAIKDMSDAQIAETLAQCSTQQQQVQAEILRLLNAQNAVVSTVAILGFEQDRRKRGIVIVPALRTN
jgi:hypothetical protein